MDQQNKIHVSKYINNILIFHQSINQSINQAANQSTNSFSNINQSKEINKKYSLDK